ncbi:DUF1990 family protein [Cryobacterium sp. TMT1-2-2]|uniref:DUF1990 family protein n=1 Tax=Cryobacterium sp. TMT1-2-2 TaxID=1259233 RepID=UPI00106C5A58|nr:DUF1990 family protein [Cryobacterium sp. TMT1-2-2]TFD11173.1 DUF1990 family protein [Cryobacterium sp. TMT1-2-2]
MTSPELHDWPASDPKFRRSEVSAVVGSGDAVWERAAGDVLRWRVKTARRRSSCTATATKCISRCDR